MSTQRATKVILLVVAVGLVLWDVFVAAEPTPGDTISEVMLRWALRHPVIPFAIGVVCGHVFWGQRVDHADH
jgi:hypothetical protein